MIQSTAPALVMVDEFSTLLATTSDEPSDPAREQAIALIRRLGAEARSVPTTLNVGLNTTTTKDTP